MPKEHTLCWKCLDFDQAAGGEVNFVPWLGDADTRNWCKLMGLQSLYLISGIRGYPHIHVWICIRTQPKGILGHELTILGVFPASISRVGECCSPSWLSASSTSWTSHETFFVIYAGRQGAKRLSWSPRHRLQGHSRSDHVCEVWSCPAQGCSGSQLQWHLALGMGCWKMEHLGSTAKHLNWGCWGLSPEPGPRAHTVLARGCVPGTCVHTAAPCMLQLSCSQGTWGLGGHTTQFTGPSF